MGIGDLLAIRDKWKDATRKGKVALLFVGLVPVVLLILEIISRIDPTIEFVENHNIINKTMGMINTPVMTTTYASLVIFVVIIILVISAALCVFVLTYDQINTIRYKRMKYAYEKLKQEYDELDKEKQKLIGKYRVKVDKPMEIELKGSDNINLTKHTAKDRMREGTLSSEEAYRLATKPKK